MSYAENGRQPHRVSDRLLSLIPSQPGPDHLRRVYPDTDDGRLMRFADEVLHVAGLVEGTTEDRLRTDDETQRTRLLLNDLSIED